MAEPGWLFVERVQGRMRRVTVLDDNFEVLVTHDRGIASADIESDDCALLRAVALEDLLRRSA